MLAVETGSLLMAKTGPRWWSTEVDPAAAKFLTERNVVTISFFRIFIIKHQNMPVKSIEPIINTRTACVDMFTK